MNQQTDDLITINEAKRMIRKHNLIIKDTSGSNSYGYSFAIFRRETVEEPVYYQMAVGDPLSQSETVYINARNKKGGMGAYAPRFRRSQIEKIINE
jgi:hypothetical protein